MAAVSACTHYNTYIYYIYILYYIIYIIPKNSAWASLFLGLQIGCDGSLGIEGVILKRLIEFLAKCNFVDSVEFFETFDTLLL